MSQPMTQRARDQAAAAKVAAQYRYRYWQVYGRLPRLGQIGRYESELDARRIMVTFRDSDPYVIERVGRLPAYLLGSRHRFTRVAP